MISLLSKLGIQTSNDKILALLSFVIFIPILLDFIAGLTSGQSSNITMIIYGVSLVYFLYFGRDRIKLKNILILLFFYFICLINNLIFPESEEYFNIGQYLILFFYLPLGFLLFKTIESWDNFIDIIFKFAPLAIIIGIYVIFFTAITTIDRSETYVTYMEFSYALMPFVCASFAYYIKHKDTFALILFIIGLAEMLSFGSRGALLNTLIFAILLRFTQNQGHKIRLIIFSFFFIVVVINFESILEFLSQIPLFENSYILRKALDGGVLQHNSREIILMNCENRLSTMGAEVSGLFGDRPYCGSVYPHNIIYEILMHWGWFIGTGLLLFFASLFIKGLLRNSSTRFITIFFMSTIMAKFFISDSYLNNGLFWLMIACMLSINNTTVPVKKHMGNSLK